MNAAQKVQLTKANDHYRAGQFREAEQIYFHLHEIEPDNTGILMRLGEIALWNNKTATAEDYLKTAVRHSSWLERIWPLNIQLNSLLAATYYRQDRFQQAAQFYKKAAGRLVFGPFSDLNAIGTQLALFNEHTSYLIEGAETTRIPFTMTDPLPVIHVSINGSKPAPFFIDTGGAEVIIDTELAENVGVTSVQKLRSEGGGTKGAMGLGKVDTVTMGDITISNVPVHIMNTHPFAAVFDGLPVKGVIGTRLLMHFLATIDYINGHLILRNKSSHLETQTAKIFPFWLVQTHYMLTFATLNGIGPMLFFVDTGLARKGFSASEQTLREAGIIVDWSKADTGIAAFGNSEAADITADRLTLGSDENAVVVENIPGIAFKKPFPVLGYKLGFYVGGVVSHKFFRNYALTLDFVGMRLILHP